MNEHSCKARTALTTTNKYIEEHNALHHHYYVGLGKAKQENIEHKSSILLAQARWHRVDSELDSLMKVKIPLGSAHRKAKALVNAVGVTKWRVRLVGAEQELFSNHVVISS